MYVQGELHSWWIWPQVNILSWLHVVCMIVDMPLYHCYLHIYIYPVAQCLLQRY